MAIAAMTTVMSTVLFENNVVSGNMTSYRPSPLRMMRRAMNIWQRLTLWTKHTSPTIAAVAAPSRFWSSARYALLMAIHVSTASAMPTSHPTIRYAKSVEMMLSVVIPKLNG